MHRAFVKHYNNYIMIDIAIHQSDASGEKLLRQFDLLMKFQ